MPSTQLYPEVIDVSTLGAKFTSPLYLPVGIEGQADSGGTGSEDVLYLIESPAEANGLFGSASSLAKLVNFVLERGVNPVVAVASKKGSAPLLADRQGAWELLESDLSVRLRLTDSVTQGDLVELAKSANYANSIYNKQIAFVGLASGTAKASLSTAATAIETGSAEGSKRTVLVAPGVYDQNGVLISGAYAAAAIAAEVARNPDISDDLDLKNLPLLTGIEKEASSLPVFRVKVVAGTPVNDFEDLLQDGVSPLQSSRTGAGVQITHLRTVYSADGTFDSLMTRLIIDQLFVDVKNYVLDAIYLRRGNTEEVRNRIKSGVEALLAERRAWLNPITQVDDTLGWNVTVTSSPDNRQVTIAYEGVVVRGISTIQVAANLSIPV